jgi:hypothetical protein
LTSLASLVPCLGGLLSLAIGIYVIILSVRAMKVVHTLTTGRAVISVLWVPILAFVLGCCIAFFTLVVAGPAIGNVFSTIMEGIGTPVP